MATKEADNRTGSRQALVPALPNAGSSSNTGAHGAAEPASACARRWVSLA